MDTVPRRGVFQQPDFHESSLMFCVLQTAQVEDVYVIFQDL